MDTWIVNGSKARNLDLNDRGLAYGDGLFETIAIRAGRCRFVDDHLQRLLEGCRRLAIPPPNTDRLQADMQQLITTRKCEFGTLKIILTRGSAPRGYGYDPESIQPNLIVGISAGTMPPHRDGVHVRYCATPVSRNSALAGLKSLNRLPQVLARAEWHDSAITEGLMSDDRGNLIGGTMTNLFIVRHEQLLTPRVNECGIAGVMRSKILKVAAEQNIRAAESRLTKVELEKADEIFLSNSLIGIWPVHQLDNLSFATGSITRALRAGLAAEGVTECAT